MRPRCPGLGFRSAGFLGRPFRNLSGLSSDTYLDAKEPNYLVLLPKIMTSVYKS